MTGLMKVVMEALAAAAAADLIIWVPEVAWLFWWWRWCR